jgi:hypothetical protein
MKKRGLLISLEITCIAFVCAGSVLYWMLNSEYSQAKSAQNWQAVNATFVSNGATICLPHGGSAYFTPEIRYKYTLADKQYEGAKLGFLFPDRFAATSAGQGQAMLASATLARSGRVFFNPQDPTQSVASIDHDYTGEFRRRSVGLLRNGGVAFLVFAGLFCLGTFLDEKPQYLRDSDNPPNQSPDPTLASGTSPAGQEPRHR